MKLPLLLALLLSTTCAWAQSEPLKKYVGLNYLLTEDVVGFTLIADSTSAHPYEAESFKKGGTLLMVDWPYPGWGEGVHAGMHYFVRTSKLALAEKVPSYLKEVKTGVGDNSEPNGSNYNGRSIQTGPRGGRYYINSNGNKTYIKR